MLFMIPGEFTRVENTSSVSTRFSSEFSVDIYSATEEPVHVAE